MNKHLALVNLEEAYKFYDSLSNNSDIWHGLFRWLSDRYIHLSIKELENLTSDLESVLFDFWANGLRI